MRLYVPLNRHKEDHTLLSTLVGAWFVLIALVALQPALAQRQYYAQDLGTATGNYGSQTTFNQAYGINNNAYVVGEASDGSGEIGTKAFFWEYGWMFAENDPMNNDYLYFRAINDYGQVAGSSGWTGQNAVLWYYGSVTVLGPGRSYGINNAGEVVGQSNSTAFAYGPSNYLITGYQMNNLGTLGGSYSVANGINNNDVIVGSSYLSGDGVQHAFVSRLEGHFFNFGIWYWYDMFDLDSGSSYTSTAAAINDNNVIAGQQSRWDGTSYPVLYQYDTSTDTVAWKAGLGSPYSDYPYYSGASAINNANIAVGFFNSNYRSIACVWDEYGAQDLNTRIAPGLGWNLYTARGINNSGQIICDGTSGTLTHAFLLSPINIAALYVNPSPVVGGQNATGTIYLNYPTAFDTTIYLSSTNTAATVPYYVTIPAGASYIDFPITTSVISSAKTGNIQTTYNGATQSAALTVIQATTKVYVMNDQGQPFSGTPGQTIALKGILRRTFDNTGLAGRTLTFKVDGNVVGTATTVSSGSAWLNGYKVPEGVGAHTVTVTFAGDGTYNAGTGTGTLNISKGNTKVYVMNDQGNQFTGARGQVITLKGILRRTSDNTGIAGKTLKFYVDGTFVGNVNTISSGSALLTGYKIPTSMASGVHTVTVDFAGGNSYNAGSGTGTLTVP